MLDGSNLRARAKLHPLYYEVHYSSMKENGDQTLGGKSMLVGAWIYIFYLCMK